jgi:hypothetical protein
MNSSSSANPLRLMAPSFFPFCLNYSSLFCICSFHSLIPCSILTFEVLNATPVHITAYLDVTPCSLVEFNIVSE